MKRLILIAIAAMLWQFSAGQKSVTTYYDWSKIHPRQKYTVNSAGQMTGAYLEYDQGGIVVKEYTYLNGAENGICIDYFVKEHDQREIQRKATYKNGVLNGPYLENNFVSGTLVSQGNYVNGMKEGKWTLVEYIPENEGKVGFEYIKRIRDFKDDRDITQGSQTDAYYPSSKIAATYTLKKGKRVGNEITYFPDGREQKHNQYDSTGEYFMYKKEIYNSGQLKYYQTYHNRTSYEGPNIWTTEDTLWDYKEDGTPTDFMKQQAENYTSWKAKFQINAFGITDCDSISANAKAFFKTKNYKNAITQYNYKKDRCGNIGSSDIYYLGLSYYNNGDSILADTTLAEFISRNPTSPDGYFQRARVKLKLGKGEDFLSRPYYLKYIELASSDPAKYKSSLIEAYLYMVIFYAEQDKNKAKEYLDSALSLDPADPTAIRFREALK